MSTNVIYVRFGLRTNCYCCGKPFTPEHPDTMLCPDCPPDEALSEDVLQTVEVDTVTNLTKSEK
jgi:hypothetical protein